MNIFNIYSSIILTANKKYTQSFQFLRGCIVYIQSHHFRPFGHSSNRPTTLWKQKPRI